MHSISKMNPRSKESVNHVQVGDDATGQRLDNYLTRHLKGVPKSHLYRLIRTGEVRVNGRRAKPDTRLEEGDQVRLPPVRVAAAPVSPLSDAMLDVGPDIPVVFEDEWLLVVNKPAGVAVHGGSGIRLGLIERLRVQRSELKYLELVHRLDRETSGLLLVAKKRRALVGLHEMMKQGQLDKRYQALVLGRWPHASKDVKWPLLKYLLPDGERRVRVSDEGVHAHTRVRLLQAWSDFALVEAQLKTGRTHQIRVHLAAEGHPIAGDDKYGQFPRNKELAQMGLKRMFLHAQRLGFQHPITGAALQLEAALPPALQQFLDFLHARTRSVSAPEA